MCRKSCISDEGDTPLPPRRNLAHDPGYDTMVSVSVELMKGESEQKNAGYRFPRSQTRKGAVRTLDEQPIMPENTLWDMYRGTNYEFEGPDGMLAIRVGHIHPQVDALLQHESNNCWCYITAWNPHSVSLSDQENSARHTSLRQDLKAMNLTFYEGWGRGQNTTWPPEKSLFVAGLNERDARALAHRYEQHAVVWGAVGSEAQLLDCRT